MSRQPVLFIHGLWIHSSAWRLWAERYERAGYEPVIAGWPGDGETVDETRRQPERVGGYGVAEVVSHYVEIISRLQ